MLERWKPIPLHPGYEVSSLGRVRSTDREVCGRKLKGRILKLNTGTNGYARCQLGKSNHKNIHEAVLEAFIGPRPEGMESCHRDGVRSNNNLSNLRWGTRRSNALDRERHGTGISGESNPRAKLSDADVVLIRKLRRDKFKLKEIAEKFGVTKANISYICRGETRNG